MGTFFPFSFHFYRYMNFLSTRTKTPSNMPPPPLGDELVANISILLTNAYVPRSQLRMLPGIGLLSTKRSN